MFIKFTAMSMLVKAETETNMDLAEIETRLVKTLTEFPTPYH